MTTEKRYFPFKQSHAIPPTIECDALNLCIDLKRSRYPSFATSFGEYIDTKENRDVIALIVNLVDICVKDGHSFCIETLYPDQYNENLSLFSGFRFWFPIAHKDAQVFKDAFNIKLNDPKIAAPSHDFKKRRVDTTETNPFYLSEERFASAVASLYGNQVYFSLTQSYADGPVDSSQSDHVHIQHELECISAETYFDFLGKAMLEDDQSQDNEDTVAQNVQNAYANYIKLSTNTFYPRVSIRRHMRYIDMKKPLLGSQTNKLFQSGSDLLQYFFPVYEPSDEHIRSALKIYLTNIGSRNFGLWKHEYESMSMKDIRKELKCDPIALCGLSAKPQEVLHRNPQYAILSEDEKILDDAYPTLSSFKLRSSTTRQDLLFTVPTDNAICSWYKSHTTELMSLISSNANGIPSIYHLMHEEATDILYRISKKYIEQCPRDSDIRAFSTMMSKYFYAPRNTDGYTIFGAFLRKISNKASEAFCFFPRQDLLFMITYARQMTIAHNIFSGCNVVLVSGPTETGKSHACLKTHNCTSRSVACISDVKTEKAPLTAGNTMDMKSEFEDECNSLIPQKNKSDDSVKIKQTMIQRGFVIVRRSEPDPEHPGRFITVSKRILCRTFLLAGTNEPEKLGTPVVSRSIIISLPPPTVAELTRSTSMAQRVLITRMTGSIQKSAAYEQTMQLLSSLQGAYWGRHAGGLIADPDISMLNLFVGLLEDYDDKIKISPRTMEYITNISMAFMVMDLIHKWYATPLGRKHHYDAGAETEFYDRYSIVRMPHIIVAYNLLERSTSMEAHLLEVGQVIKSLVETDYANGHEPYFSHSGPYVRLRCRSMSELSRTVLTNLGQSIGGLVKRLLTQIESSKTNGQINLRQESTQMGHQLFVNTNYIASIVMPLERDILKFLRTQYYEKQGYLSYDEKAYAFSPDIIAEISDPARRKPEFASFSEDDIQKALRLLQLGKTSENVPFFIRMNTVEVCSLIQTPGEHHKTQNAVPCETISNMFKVPVPKTGYWVCQRELFKPRYVDSKLHKLYTRAMLIGGTYKPDTLVYLGPSMHHHTRGSDTYIKLPPLTPAVIKEHTVTMKNIYYRPNGAEKDASMDGPIGGESEDEDDTLDDFHMEQTNILFHPMNEKETFSPTSETEKRVIEHRYRQRWKKEPTFDICLD